MGCSLLHEVHMCEGSPVADLTLAHRSGPFTNHEATLPHKSGPDPALRRTLTKPMATAKSR